MKMFNNVAIEKCTQTVGNKNEVDDVMRLILIIQSFFGVHILSPSWSWKRCFMKQLASLFLFSYVIAGTFEILLTTNDVKLIAEAVYTFMITLVALIKFFLFTLKRTSITRLYIELKSTFYEIIKNDSEEKLKDILDIGKRLVYVLFIATIFPILTYEIRVLWFYINGELVTMSRTTSILMPMKSPFFELGLLLHSTYMFEVAFQIMQIDMWFVLFMFFFGVASDVTIKSLAITRHQAENDEDYANRLRDSLRRFYKLHVKLVTFLSTLNDSFKWITMVPQIGIGIGFGLILLLMSKGVEWSFAINVLPVFGELFTYSWFGELVKDKVNDWKMALLDFDWPSLRAEDKKSYYIIVCYLNKNFGIEAAVGNDLTLVTITNVLKFSYQAYTMLMTMG